MPPYQEPIEYVSHNADKGKEFWLTNVALSRDNELDETGVNTSGEVPVKVLPYCVEVTNLIKIYKPFWISPKCHLADVLLLAMGKSKLGIGNKIKYARLVQPIESTEMKVHGLIWIIGLVDKRW